MPALTNVERLRKAGLLSGEPEDEIDPELAAEIESLTREEVAAIIAVKQKVGLEIDIDVGPLGCGF